MSIDINKLSTKELQALITQAKKRKTTLAKRKPIAAVQKKVAALLKAEGYTVAELFGNAGAAARAPRSASPAAKKPRKATSKVAPKYRNPENASETWTGRGKQPRWLAAHTGAGRSLAEFLIK
ncbi:H-NS family nucleoid-associated regulatory protein [Montanilutibacter psychrotolerans]|uniref:H-NS histone family protein n=1 Tax=Montanilutibacter psychrotolerans TaxID=1327343 RepID=A0A3M8SSN3_9GAMM|nr:H-NS histone family protein [Lysobacter psychrotolerans]RNF84337.1 H-NS histone family protein [Lysobacter psychrotolerans]